jgi:transposase
VTDADAGPDGALEVWAVTDSPGAEACPGCGTASSRVHDLVVTRPRDVRRSGDPVDPRWVKRRLKCENAGCRRKTFTERIPAVPPGHHLTPRLREQAGAEIHDRATRKSGSPR